MFKTFSSKEKGNLWAIKLYKKLSEGTLSEVSVGDLVARLVTLKHFTPSVESRSLLEKYNIDINDAANGIPIGHPNPHGFMHTQSFHSYVKERLYSVEKKMHLSGMGKKATRSAIRKELRNIGKDVLKKIK